MARSAMQSFLFGGQPSSLAKARSISWTGTELVGRIFLSAIFVLSGVAKLADPSGTAEHMAAQGIPMIGLLLPLAALVEIVGGLSLITGTFARIGATMLILFLIPTTVLFHDFWAYQGPERVMQMANFMKNVAIGGGLMLVLAHGAARLSVDDRIERRLRSRV